jgi:hypothetical protein
MRDFTTRKRRLTPGVARRLAITRQRLAGKPPAATRTGIMSVVRDLGCLQLDPISVVARSPLLVLWSRLGPYDVADLDALLWQERRLFKYWAHAASIVLTEDYPIHQYLMRLRTKRLASPSGSAFIGRLSAWMKANEVLRRHVLSRLRHRGPLALREFEDRAVTGWRSGGWTTGRNVERMLSTLWIQGKVMVAGRAGLEKRWDLAEQWLADWTPRERLSDREVVWKAAQRSLRALGVATPRQIGNHFTVGRYPGLVEILDEMERRRVIEREHRGARPGVARALVHPPSGSAPARSDEEGRLGAPHGSPLPHSTT